MSDIRFNNTADRIMGVSGASPLSVNEHGNVDGYVSRFIKIQGGVMHFDLPRPIYVSMDGTSEPVMVEALQFGPDNGELDKWQLLPGDAREEGKNGRTECN